MKRTRGVRAEVKTFKVDSTEETSIGLIHEHKKRLMEIEKVAPGVEVLNPPFKSSCDKKDYRVIKLQNGLRALLISDQTSLKSGEDLSGASDAESDLEAASDNGEDNDDEIDSDDTDDDDLEIDDEMDRVLNMEGEDKSQRKCRPTRYLSAASLCVGVGSFEDPREIQGLMHFLEHMVFMGSEKYPKENCFDNFIKKSGGSDNAHTDYENTTFYFDVQEIHFEKSLDMFAQFFISPLMLEDAMQRERKSVHSEFQELINDDDCRKQQIFACVAEERHPMSLFTIGNEKTLLLEISDKELHAKLHDIRSKLYSAQYMTLAVQSRESLDRLQEMVEQIFSKIPNNSLVKPSYEHFGFPFALEKFHKLYKVVPVSDRHTLDLNWALPSLLKSYEYKPLHYIAYLIGHEGFGSIISYFKKRVLAVSIYAGNDESGFEHNTTYAIFNIQIHLTDEGFSNVKEVIKVIFQFLKLLRLEGPNERIFSEIQKMEKIDFDFAEEKTTMDNVQELSEDMQLYPPEHYLSGGSLLFKYDPDLIKDCLAKLEPSNCNIMISSKAYENQDLQWQEEKWFGTKYCVEGVPRDWIDEWENAPLHPDLHLPAPNDFIPDTFDLIPAIPASESPQYPQSILKDQKGELWFKEDHKFKLPRAYCYIYVILEQLRESPRMGAMLDLFLNTFTQHIMETLYPAKMAQYETGLKAAELGFTIRINGFNQKLHKCLETILSQIEDFKKCLDDKTFEEMKQQQLKSYHNAILCPDVLRRDTRLVILQEIHWQAAEKMKALSAITKQEFFTEFVDRMVSQKYIKMLVQGNISSEDAKKMYQLATDKTSNLSEVECPAMRTRRCKNGEWFIRFNSLNPASTNTSVVNYYQGEQSCLKSEILNEFIIMAMDEPVFDTLRTKDQLGYHVFCTNRNTFGVLGISVTVNSQANKYSVTHINERIEAFLKVFTENLKNISDEELNSLKDTLKNYKLTVDLTLKEEVDRNWAEIVSGECLFSRHVHHLALIPSITSKEVASYLHGIVSSTNNDSYRKLSVQVVGSPCPEKGVVPCHEDTLKKSDGKFLDFLSATDEEQKSGFCPDQFIQDLRLHSEDMVHFEPLKRILEHDILLS